MKKPNFFIIGAPKCGTTSMATWLGEHPQIFMSVPKEPSFFCSDIDLPRKPKTINKYLKLFQNANNKHIAIGEASATYMLSQVAIKDILRFNHSAQFIVMLRNPIDMAKSWHGNMLIEGFSDFFDDFEEDWRVRFQGSLELHISKSHDCWDPIFLQYDRICMLGDQVQRLLQTVDVNSVLFIVMDDLIKDPLREYQKVLKFLGVTYDGKTQFPIYNSAKGTQYKSVIKVLKLIKKLALISRVKYLLKINYSTGLLKKIYELNEKSYKPTPLRPEFKQELVEFFREDIQLLSSLLNRDLSHWMR